MQPSDSQTVRQSATPSASVGGALGPDSAKAAGLGAVFTRPWAVDLVLDVAGYTPNADLASGRVTEPSCGDGAFLTAVVDRLAASCLRHGRGLEATVDAVRAYDLDPMAVAASRAAVRAALAANGLTASQAARLAHTWVSEGDFLLGDCEPSDWVVGNPPYVRLEEVPAERTAAYRQRWGAMRGRADVYVGFIEAGLAALPQGGTLTFICADRWMRNQYGKRLRSLIEDGFAVDTVVTLHDSDVFENRVAAYPAVFRVRRGDQGPALIVEADRRFDQVGADQVAHLMRRQPPATGDMETGHGFSAAWTPGWSAGAASWPTGRPDRVALVASLESKFPALADVEAGVRTGIGIASGADSVFLTTDTNLVEPDRLLPLAVSSDLATGQMRWSGTRLVNPWGDDDLVELADYRRLSRYLHSNETHLRGRHVAQRQPDRWFRTLDRPLAGLAAAEKLLVPDLRKRVTPVLDTQGLYPHHNLVWITSDVWDLRVLGGLLLSDFGTLFVETYSPRMNGGALRVTTEYLRRIRVPAPHTIPARVQADLIAAFARRDVAAATAAASIAYDTDLPAP